MDRPATLCGTLCPPTRRRRPFNRLIFTCQRQSVFASSVKIFILWSLFLLAKVSSSGVFEFRFDHFENPLARDQDGHCCSNRTLPAASSVSSSFSSASPSSSSSDAAAACSSACRIFFRVCLKQYQNNIDTDTPCTFGEVTTPVLGDNGIQKAGYIVPIFFNFSWPKTCSYIVDIGHESFEGSRTIPGKSKLIYQLKVQTVLEVGSEWSLKSYEVGARSKAKLDFAIRVTCNENYYGDQCSDYCRSRNDNHGHFLCSEKGQITCLPGWQGTDNYCKTPECAPGCDRDHGSCDQPNECKCRFGWEGSRCDRCMKYPGCLHGTCNKPFECNCKDGWGGILCNQDLNFCTNHRPCKNGGSCKNSGHGSYTCKCPPNTTGKNCEIELTTCDHEPCQNGATCRAEAQKGNYTCDCPLGYTGRHCEALASLCANNPCTNGGTCIQGPSGYLCICPPGDLDEKNNCRRFTGCHEKPCRNDGKCASGGPSGYNCSCQEGFSGKNCEVNQDDCVGVRCLNGGTCRDGVRDFKCQCPPGYSGKLCHNRVDLCRGFPCANGGTCLDSDGLDFKCTCAPGFTGKHCHININECESSPCLNGGLCHDRVNEFTCICPPELSGPVCQFRVNGEVPFHRNGSSSSLPTDGLAVQDGAPAYDPQPDDSSRQEINLIYLISAVILTPLLIVAVCLITIMLKRRSRYVEKERRKNEELARSQNEYNSRSLKNKCLTNDDDEREFRGNRIVNNLNDASSIKQKELVFNNKLDPYGSSHHLNRSLTLPRFNNIDQQQKQLQQQHQHHQPLPHPHHQMHHHVMKHQCHHQSTQKLGPATVNMQKSLQHHTSQHNLSTFKSVGNGLYV